MTLPKESYLIREIIDNGSYRDVAIRDLSGKKLRKVVELLSIYSPYIEALAKQMELTIKNLTKDTDEKT